MRGANGLGLALSISLDTNVHNATIVGFATLYYQGNNHDYCYDTNSDRFPHGTASLRVSSIPISTLFIFILIAFVGLAFKNLSNLGQEKPISFNTEVRVGNSIFMAGVATTNEETMRGLSGTKALKENQAMLFVFDREDKWGIWMKDMNFSIDIVWINKDRKISYIREGISPDTYPQIFYPPDMVLYVLELPSGAVERVGIKIGGLLLY